MKEVIEREEFYNFIKTTLDDVDFSEGDKLFEYTDDLRAFQVMNVCEGSSMPLTEFLEMVITKLGIEIGD